MLFGSLLCWYRWRHKKPRSHFKVERLLESSFWRKMEHKLGKLQYYNPQHSTQNPEEIFVILVYFILMWEFLFFSSPFFISFSWNHVLVYLWSYVFWLRSFNKTGVGCDNCVQPHSQNEHLINPPLSPVLAIRLSALWGCRISFLCPPLRLCQCK